MEDASLRTFVVVPETIASRSLHEVDACSKAAYSMSAHLRAFGDLVHFVGKNDACVEHGKLRFLKMANRMPPPQRDYSGGASWVRKRSCSDRSMNERRGEQTTHRLLQPIRLR